MNRDVSAMVMRVVMVGAAGAGLVSGFAGCASNRPAPMTAPSDEDLRRAMAIASEGQREFNQKRYDRAIELYREALTLRPDMGSVYNNLGLALQARGTDLDHISAIEAFKRAADILPVDERPYQNLGVLYHERGFSDEALRYFNMALERNPNSLESLRGSVGAAKLMLRSDDAGLQRVNRLLLIDNSAEWRKIAEFERLRIQHDLAESLKSATTWGAPAGSAGMAQ
jgi:tetratricopeptide (TPR) repeat protein